MSLYRRPSARTVALGLLTWLLVALVVHLKAERRLIQLSKQDQIISSAHKYPLDAVIGQPKVDYADTVSRTDTNGTRRTAVVVAKTRSESATWFDEYFPQWEKNIYSLDNRSAKLKVPKNKGRESMVYLSYIIDHYDQLPDNVLFLHPNRYQWHNDDPDYDGVPMLRRFQFPYLEQEGYVNIRCTWSLGCPSEIKPLEEEGQHRVQVHAGGDYKQAFQLLFPEAIIPRYVGVSCCAQFAATKEKIRERKKGDYERYRKWLLETDLDDEISGRVMEYSWHMIFGKEPIHCPSAQACYCNVFGLCGLDCGDEASCGDRYTLPPYATLPEGWPYIGWDGEPRERTSPEKRKRWGSDLQCT